MILNKQEDLMKQKLENKENLINCLQIELNNLVEKIKKEKLKIKAVWFDEYGGEQSVELERADNLKIINFE